MIQASESPDAMRLPREPLLRQDRWTRLAMCLALLAASVAVVLFLALAVIPSAGAAGGCGGG
jgi:hypothetical protein